MAWVVNLSSSWLCRTLVLRTVRYGAPSSSILQGPDDSLSASYEIPCFISWVRRGGGGGGGGRFGDNQGLESRVQGPG